MFPDTGKSFSGLNT